MESHTGEVFRRAVYLERLSSKEWFESDDWFLKHISQSLLGIQDLLTKHQARATMVRREYELLCQALTQFQERCCDLLEKLLQEKTPQHRVVCLITNLTDILALSALLLGRHQGNLEAIITQSLKESVQESYNGHKLRLTTELRLNAYSSPVSAELISKLIGHIQSEVQYIQDHYQQLFQLYHVEVMESAASTFYSCLMADVSVLCDEIQGKHQEQEQMRESVDPEMVAMARKLDQLDQTWKNYIPAISQQWRKSLTKSAVHWFQYLIRDMQAMIVYSICRDKFKAVHLTFNQEDEGSDSSYNSYHRPSNANPLTQSIGSAFASVIPKDQKRGSEGVSNNNTIRPNATHHPQHTDISFNPSGVLNFKQPVRTQSFPQIKELLDRSEKWSAAGSSRNEEVVGFTMTAGNSPHALGGGGDAFQPVDSNTRESSGALRNCKISSQVLTHSQSFPELSAAAPAPEDIPGPSGVQEAAMTLPLPRHAFHDDYTSGKDQSTSTSRSRSNSSSQHHSDHTYGSDVEDSTDASSRSVTSSRRQHRDQLRAVFEQLGIFSGEGFCGQSEITLPISSSLVDMVYVVRHSCSLMYDICSVLKPEMSAEVEQDELQQKLLVADLQQMLISPLQGVTFAIRLFASNMLAMDLCATPACQVNNMISKEVLNRVFIAQNAGLLGGCRHERSGLPDCNIYFNRDMECLCDNFEPINPEMCLRINNVQGLVELLPDLLTDLDGAVRSSEMQEDSKTQRPLQRYLHNLMTGQIKLLAFKVNQMFSQALGVLLQLDMGSYSIADRLHPLTACIHNHLVATSSWLYHQCYQIFCQELWKCIVKDIEKLVEELLLHKTEDRSRAMLLLQTIAHLMETVINHSEHGLSADVFLEPADGVIQVLQLYTWPTSRLIQLYQGFLQKAWEGTTNESWPIRLQTLRILQRLLCQQRKCFTGNELLKALVQVQKDEEPVENIWDWAYLVSEQLLRCGLVRRMMASGHTVDLSALEQRGNQNLHFASQGEISDYEDYSYPEVTLHSIPRTSRRKQTLGSTTNGEDTDAMSDEVSRRLHRSKGMDESTDDETDDDEVQHIVQVLAEVYKSPQPAQDEQPVMPSGSSLQSTSDRGPIPPDEQSVVPSKSGSRSTDDLRPSQGVTVGPAVLAVDSELSSSDPPEAKDVDGGKDESSMQVTTKEIHSSKDVADGAEDEIPCLTGTSDAAKDKFDQDEHELNGNIKDDKDMCYPDQSLQKDNESAEGDTEEGDSAVPGTESHPNAQESNRAESHHSPLPSKVKPIEPLKDDTDEGYFRAIHDDTRTTLNTDNNAELIHPEVECVERNQISSYDRSEQTKSENKEPSNSGAVSIKSDGNGRHQINLEHGPGSRGNRSSTFSESSSSDTDCELSSSPHAGSPAWSPRGVVFTADSQQLYCFSQVYDFIPQAEEGKESLQESQRKSKAFQRMVENLDAGFSPEMVVAIIGTRRDESSKNFINQIGDESLREASCIKRLCRACFKLR
nr:uncharacterized protein LOC129272748 [Lytechinus pictus]